jgi:hypothetical protein
VHRDKSTQQFRIWLRPETVKQLKLLTLILGRDDWNLVADDMIRMGVAYTNETAKLELAEWSDQLTLFDLASDMKLHVLKGDLPHPEAK